MIKLEVSMIERNFAQQILFLPISNGADELRIISGYSTCLLYTSDAADD